MEVLELCIWASQQRTRCFTTLVAKRSARLGVTLEKLRWLNTTTTCSIIHVHGFKNVYIYIYSLSKTYFQSIYPNHNLHIKYVPRFCQHRQSWLRSWKQTGVSVFTEDSLNKIRPMAVSCVTGRQYKVGVCPFTTTTAMEAPGAQQLIEDSKENSCMAFVRSWLVRAGAIFCATIFPFDH